jgi:hypothetical protein
MSTGIRMTKKNRLAILTRAREILSNPYNWAVGQLRTRQYDAEGNASYRYCALGAIEQAAYDLGLAEKNDYAFRSSTHGVPPLGYALGAEIGLEQFAYNTRRINVANVNDGMGYKPTLLLLDEFITETKKPTPRVKPI